MIFNRATPIEYLRLKSRLYNSLKRHKINTVGAILDLTETDVVKILGIHACVLTDIQTKLQSFLDDPNITDVVQVILYDGDSVDHAVIYYMDKAVFNDCIIRFKDKQGVLRPNILVEESGLPLRIKNGLRQAGVSTLLDVINAPYGFIESCSNIGAGSRNTLLRYLNDNCVIRKSSSVCISIHNGSDIIITYDIEDLTKLFCDDINVIMACDVSNDYVHDKIESLGNLIITQSESYADIRDFLTDPVVMREMYADSRLMDACRKIAFDALESHPEGLFENEFSHLLPHSFFIAYTCDYLFKPLIDEHQVDCFNKKYFYVYNSVFDYFKSVANKKWSDMIIDRFSGMTLAEVATKYNITRERVRQITTKSLRQKPPVREDKYAYWFEKYCLPKNEFMSIFEESAQTHAYLSIAYKRGALPISSMLDDDHIDDELKIKVETVLTQNKIAVCGEMINPTPREILYTLMKCMHSNTSCSVNQIRDEYMDICKKYNLTDSNGVDNNHTFEARLTRNDIRYVLVSQGHCVRYYDIDAHDIPELIRCIDFNKYDNMCVSTYKIFVDYQMLMSKYEIQNEYELHNIFRKNSKLIPASVSFSRMPLLEIGDVDRHAQVEKMLIEHAPISQTDLAKLFFDAYGIDELSFAMNWLKDFWMYYADGVYNVIEDVFTESELASLTILFPSDFYFIDDMKKMCDAANLGINSSRLDVLALKQLGFRTYNDYVIRTRYSSLCDYVGRMFDENDIVDVTTIDNRLAGVHAIKRRAAELCQSYSFFEIKPRKYLSAKQVLSEKTGVSVSDINQFCETVMALDLKYFNMHSLNYDGFVFHDFDKISSDEWFYDALLRDHASVKSYTYESSSTMILSRDDRYKPSGFISYLMESFDTILMKDFIEYIRNKYNLIFSSHYVQRWIIDTDVKYDDDTKMLYHA